MRKIILFIASSLDSYIATLDGGVDWLFTDKDYGFQDFFAGVDTVIIGRKTYDQSLAFDPDPYPGKAVYVFSRSHLPETQGQVTYVQTEVPALIEQLRAAPGRDIWLVGGGELIQMFLEQDWIDEIVLSVHPLILGNGIPLFPPHTAAPKAFHLEDVQSFESGLVQLCYGRDRPQV
jgi:dihydrofolate reductase